jgi:hypothetical protein
MPGVAFFEEAGADFADFRVMFWRPTMPEAVVAYRFTVNQGIDLSLAFSGTNPRIAGHMVGSATSDSLTFLSSTNGMMWSAPVFLANGGTADDSALAVDGMGHAAIAADRNGSNPTCGGNPYLSLSGDDGATWMASCPDNMGAARYGAYSMNALYGASRVRGTLMLGFVNDGTGTQPPRQPGIIFYQRP